MIMIMISIDFRFWGWGFLFVVSYEFMGYSQVEWKGVGVGAFSWGSFE